MPELPEVESVAAALRLNLLGRRLTGLRVRFAGVFSDSTRRVRRELLGKRLVDVHRHGKYLLLNFAGADGRRAEVSVPGYTRVSRAAPRAAGAWSVSDSGHGRDDGARARDAARAREAARGRDAMAARIRDAAAAPAEVADAHLMLHLRMTGQLLCLPDYRPDKHVHATFDFDGMAVHYRDIRKFGRFTLVDDAQRPTAIDHIGPDVMRIRFADWYPRIAGRRAPIKALLLDQGIAAGLGNIYVDEALFRAGVHPATPACDLSHDELRTVLRCGKDVMRLAIRHGGTTFINFTDFHGKPGNFRRKLRVYGRTGEPCSRCGTALERMVVGGRSSHFCPECQAER